MICTPRQPLNLHTEAEEVYTPYIVPMPQVEAVYRVETNTKVYMIMSKYSSSISRKAGKI